MDNVNNNKTKLVDRYIYISEPSEGFGGEDLVELLTFCKNRNNSVGTTGLLLYTGKYFFQVLESDRVELESILKKINADGRHFNLKELGWYKEVPNIFSDWHTHTEICDRMDSESASDLVALVNFLGDSPKVDEMQMQSLMSLLDQVSEQSADQFFQRER